MKTEFHREKVLPKPLIKTVQRMAILIAKPLFYYFGRLEIVGMEKIQNLPQSVIFAGGHRHELDVAAIGTVLRKTKFFPIHYVSMVKTKYKAFGLRGRLFYGGLLFRMLGAYPVYKGAESLDEALANHNAILEHERSVVIYPEGKITRDGGFIAARRGVGYLAAKHWKPVVPFTINGLWDLSLRQWLKRKRTIQIVFGDPIPPEALFSSPEGLTEREHQQAASQILNKIIELNTDVQKLQHAEELVHV